MTDQQKALGDRYECPKLRIDPPDGPVVTWYPNLRQIGLVHGTGEFMLSPAEVRALYDWVMLNELR